MKQSTADTLAQLIDDLAAQREEHVAAIEQIDDTFARYGIDPSSVSSTPVRGRRKKSGKKTGKRASKAASKTASKAASKTAGKKSSKKKASKAAKAGGGRKRGTFKQSGEESVLRFVAKHGSPNAKEVNDHWRKEGRKGKADNALTKLVKEGRLTRVSNPGERGGRYQVA